ncbi:hypothetical protein D1007_35715 [Hordeum vulgare]|nr:hypothetical protein D1007_35715 [Hordeum vulgare]
MEARHSKLCPRPPTPGTGSPRSDPPRRAIFARDTFGPALPSTGCFPRCASSPRAVLLQPHTRPPRLARPSSPTLARSASSPCPTFFPDSGGSNAAMSPVCPPPRPNRFLWRRGVC